MTIETKKVAKVKVGIWINRIKLRKALGKISFFYGIMLTGMSFFSFMGGLKLWGIINLGLAIPLYS